MASRRGKRRPDERARFASAVIIQLNRAESQPSPLNASTRPAASTVNPLKRFNFDFKMQVWASLATAISVALLYRGAFAQNLVLTNDDGWAVAQIRAQRDALVDAGFDVRVFILVSIFQTFSLRK